jgi:hypothetical protein
MKPFFAIFALLCLAVQPALPALNLTHEAGVPMAEHCACCVATECACAASPGDAPARSDPFLPTQRSGLSHDCPGLPVSSHDALQTRFRLLAEQMAPTGHDAGVHAFATVPLFIRHCSPLW